MVTSFTCQPAEVHCRYFSKVHRFIGHRSGTALSPALFLPFQWVQSASNSCLHLQAYPISMFESKPQVLWEPIKFCFLRPPFINYLQIVNTVVITQWQTHLLRENREEVLEKIAVASCSWVALDFNFSFPFKDVMLPLGKNLLPTWSVDLLSQMAEFYKTICWSSVCLLYSNTIRF